VITRPPPHQTLKLAAILPNLMREASTLMHNVCVHVRIAVCTAGEGSCPQGAATANRIKARRGASR
jgi:hypothetical protein